MDPYQRGRLRLAADMIVRFSVALGITTDELDELLQPKVRKPRHGRSAARCCNAWNALKACRPISSAPCSPPLTASSAM